jgi:hypothetical protein
MEYSVLPNGDRRLAFRLSTTTVRDIIHAGVLGNCDCVSVLGVLVRMKYDNDLLHS